MAMAPAICLIEAAPQGDGGEAGRRDLRLLRASKALKSRPPMTDSRADLSDRFRLKGTEPSGFDGKPLHVLYDEIRTLYVSDGRPWVIGYSGGKDSTTA